MRTLCLALALGAGTAGCGEDGSTREQEQSQAGDRAQAPAMAGQGGSGRGDAAGTSAARDDAGGAGEPQAGSSSGDPQDAGPSADAQQAQSPATATPFRIAELYLRDPRFILGSNDITDEPFLGQSVNGTLIPDGLSTDYDGDGFADVSIAVVLSPADPDAGSAQLQLVEALCAADNLASCTMHPDPELDANWPIETRAEGTCLEPVEGTAGDSAEASAELPTGPCFVTTAERDMTLEVSGIRLALSSAQVAASYDGAAPDRLVHGLIRGFMTLEDADSALLPDYLLLLAGSPLSSYLRAEERDDEQSPTGEQGWWVYLNFVAEPLQWTSVEGDGP